MAVSDTTSFVIPLEVLSRMHTDPGSLVNLPDASWILARAVCTIVNKEVRFCSVWCLHLTEETANKLIFFEIPHKSREQVSWIKSGLTLVWLKKVRLIQRSDVWASWAELPCWVPVIMSWRFYFPHFPEEKLKTRRESDMTLTMELVVGLGAFQATG